MMSALGGKKMWVPHTDIPRVDGKDENGYTAACSLCIHSFNHQQQQQQQMGQISKCEVTA